MGRGGEEGEGMGGKGVEEGRGLRGPRTHHTHILFHGAAYAVWTVVSLCSLIVFTSFVDDSHHCLFAAY